MTKPARNTVSIDARERLLEALGRPSGVVIARRTEDDRDHVEVVMPSVASVPDGSRLAEFEGFEVRYRVGSVPLAGRW
jgi:hypothetical protein